jgi:hypothetical protein
MPALLSCRVAANGCEAGARERHAFGGAGALRTPCQCGPVSRQCPSLLHSCVPFAMPEDAPFFSVILSLSKDPRACRVRTLCPSAASGGLRWDLRCASLPENGTATARSCEGRRDGSDNVFWTVRSG